jgi:hypothetical protein
VAGRWRGVLLRNGLREPVSLELSAQNRDWRGRFSAGENFVPLQEVRVTATSIHFELPGEGIFEGAIAGDSMAGSISGGANGSFALERRDATEPPWTIEFMWGP